MRLLRILFLFAVSLAPAALRADEGFHLVQDPGPGIDRTLIEKGFRIRPGEIYNPASPGAGLADAAVSVDFRWSGAFVSDMGLVLTSADPALAYFRRIGEIGERLLKEGFQAKTDAHEIRLEGEKVYSLKKVFDVTGEAESMMKGGMDAAEVSTRLEKAYSEATGLTCRLVSYWEGAKWYVHAYKEYGDVRLVVVPPESFARFGGEDGKWEWPAHRCDFAILRVYEDGKPVVPGRSLKVSLDGYSAGSGVMTMAYPIHTDRYQPSPLLRFRERTALPLSNTHKEARLGILKRALATDPSLAATYSDRILELERALRFEKADVLQSERRGIVAAKVASENWIGEDFMEGLEATVRKYATVETDKVWRNLTLRDGTFAGSYLRRAEASGNLEKAKEILLSGTRETDPAVEKALLEYSLGEYLTNLDDWYFGDYQRWIQDRFGYDCRAAAEYLWEGSLLSSPEKIKGMESLDELKEDTLLKFLSDSPLSYYDGRGDLLRLLEEAEAYSKEYRRTLHRVRTRGGETLYPDADGTLRLTFGTVGGLSPADAVFYNWYTTPAGAVKRVDPSVPGLDLDASSKAYLEADFWGRWGFKTGGHKHGMILNFLMDNDFVDGCQGAPVLDAYGSLIGVVSGGNAETLAGEVSYFGNLSECVGVDVRLALWYIERASGLKRIIKELEFS